MRTTELKKKTAGVPSAAKGPTLSTRTSQQLPTIPGARHPSNALSPTPSISEEKEMDRVIIHVSAILPL